MENKDIEQMYIRMARLCSRSERCTEDIRQKIMAEAFSESEANRIIDKLKSEKYIDDARYVNFYIGDKFRINKWGKIKIRYYLKQKGFSDDVIEEGLQGIDDTKYKVTLVKTMKGKAKTIKKKDKYEKSGMIIRFAQNRGYEPELIHRYLNEVVE